MWYFVIFILATSLRIYHKNWFLTFFVVKGRLVVEGRSKGHCVNPSFHDLANWHDQDPYLFKCRSCQIFTYMHIFAVSRQQSVYIYMSDFMWNDRASKIHLSKSYHLYFTIFFNICLKLKHRYNLSYTGKKWNNRRNSQMFTKLDVTQSMTRMHWMM